jgi:nucleoid DNA-binding protein
VTKRELVMKVAASVGMTQQEASAIVQATLDAITETLAEGHRLEIRNFGVFEVKTRESRIGRNPRTGEEVPIAPKRVPAFRPGKVLKAWVEQGQDGDDVHLFRGEDDDEPTQSASDSVIPRTAERVSPAPAPTPPSAREGEQTGLF